MKWLAASVVLIALGVLTLARNGDSTEPMAPFKLGQQFLFMPSAHWIQGPGGPEEPDGSQPYLDESTGKPVPWRDIVLRVLTFESVASAPSGKPLLKFRLEGHPHRVTVECEGGQPPRLSAIVDDAQFTVTTSARRLGSGRLFSIL